MDDTASPIYFSKFPRSPTLGNQFIRNSSSNWLVIKIDEISFCAVCKFSVQFFQRTLSYSSYVASRPNSSYVVTECVSLLLALHPLRSINTYRYLLGLLLFRHACQACLSRGCRVGVVSRILGP